MTAKQIVHELLAGRCPRRPRPFPNSGLLPGPCGDGSPAQVDLRGEGVRRPVLPGDMAARRIRIHDPGGPCGASERELIRYDAASGARTVLASLSHLTPSGASEPLSISGYQFAPDGSWVLLGTEGNGFWMFEGATSTLKQVDGGGGNTISPEGGRILFGREGDLHVHDLEADQTTRLTWTTAESVSNGRAVWSPDGDRIAFVQSDASGVRMRSMLVPTDPSYPELRQVRFARVGETIAKLRVGVVDAQGREVRWISIPSPTEGFYLGQVSWAGELRGVVGGAVQPVSGRTGLLHRQREHG